MHPVRSVGVFDSGLGGLCAVAALSELVPELDVYYFGDVARLPYGTRSAAAVRRYAAQDAAFLASCGVDAILIACGTASSAALPALAERYDIPVLGVVEPAAREALACSERGRIGVLGTQGTIASGAYERAIHALCPTAQVTSVACPMLVPLVENGEADSPMTRIALEQYLAPCREAGCDTLLLGCTHYPLLREHILALWRDVRLADAAAAGARAMAELVRADGAVTGTGRRELYTSDFSQGFEELALRFLDGKQMHFVQERVAVENWE